MTTKLAHLWLCCLELASVVCTAVPEPAIVAPCRVVNVVDGDTLDVELKLVVRVRLLDCWAPERRTPEGKKATENLKHLTSPGQALLSVPLTHERLDSAFSFGRVLGTVYVDGKSLAAEQLAGGFATKEKP